MPAFLPLSDDLLALLGCGTALLVSALTLQLVHFIQHRRRPTPDSTIPDRLRPDPHASKATGSRSLRDSAA